MKTFFKYLIAFIVSICLFVASSYIVGIGMEKSLTIMITVGIFMLVVSFLAWIVLLDEVFELHF